MKPFSPQGTYLLNHPKRRIAKKHKAIKVCTDYPMSCKGCKCYVYMLSEDCGFIVYTARPKQKGAVAESFEVAKELRVLFAGAMK